MKSLPKIMIAPNGSYKTKADHPNLPVTIEETIAEVKKTHLAGADGAHLHVRDNYQKHCLDAELYNELVSELSYLLPDLYIQVTTESAGIYKPCFQRQLISKLKCNYISASIKEITADKNEEAYKHFYHQCANNHIIIQHIIYHPSEIDILFHLVKKNIIPTTSLSLLFVLGRYTKNIISTPSHITPFLTKIKQYKTHNICDWAVCAFGIGETDCLLHALKLGGKARIGFENNLLNRNGEVANNNVERVKELVSQIET